MLPPTRPQRPPEQGEPPERVTVGEVRRKPVLSAYWLEMRLLDTDWDEEEASATADEPIEPEQGDET